MHVVGLVFRYAKKLRQMRALKALEVYMEIGQEFFGILGRLIIDPETNRVRVSIIEGQEAPEGIFVECSKKIREKHEAGTIFKMNVKVSSKPQGRLYLHTTKKNELLTEEEFNNVYQTYNK